MAVHGLDDPFCDLTGLVAAYLVMLVVPVGENKMLKTLYLLWRTNCDCLLGKAMISLIPGISTSHG